MKDVTKRFMKQPKDYGRQVNLGLTRIDMYVSKAMNIYRLLGKLQVKIILGGTVIKQFPATFTEAAALIRDYGKTYFLDIRYPASRDALLIKLTGFVPGAVEKHADEKLSVEEHAVEKHAEDRQQERVG